jgi:hypothetical protein
MANSTVLLLGPLAAVMLHEIVLRRTEVDHLALPIIITSCITYCTIVYLAGFLSANAVSASFWVPLWLYIGVYRAFLHPLQKYPGPFGAKLSKWWTVKQNWDTDLHFHRKLQQLQREYGDYVRTGMSGERGCFCIKCVLTIQPGPRELTIFDVDAIPTVLGIQSKTSKGPLFDIMDKSLHLNRDKQFHRQRRRVWDNAFKTCVCSYSHESCHSHIVQLYRTTLPRLKSSPSNCSHVYESTKVAP